MRLAGEGLGMLRRGERGKPVGDKENVRQLSFRAGAAKLHAYRGTGALWAERLAL